MSNETKVFQNNNGWIEEIREGHFKVTRFTEIGFYTVEMRHATLDDAIYQHLI